MRVFYALTFEDKYKEQISYYRDIIANISAKGRFIETSNIHLTLEFIGDVRQDELDDLIDVLDSLTLSPIELTASYLGAFRKKNRDIIWLGLDSNKQLDLLVKQLRKLLSSKEYKIENQKYVPHITLGRQIIFHDNLEEFKINPIKIPIKSIALMESKRVHDKLVYEPICELEMK